MARRRLRCLGFQPSDHAGPGVRERVDASDARPRDVARAPGGTARRRTSASTSPSRIRYVSSNGWSCGPARPSRLVLHHEHREQLRAEIGVDHHLHRDPAVDEQRGPHARRHGEHVLRLLVDLHVRRVDVAERTRPRVAHVDRRRARARGAPAPRTCRRRRASAAAAPACWPTAPARPTTLRSACGAPDRRHAVVAGTAAGTRPRRCRRRASPSSTYRLSS